MLIAFLFLYIACAFYCDIKFRKVYNAQICVGIGVGLLLTAFPDSPITLYSWFLGVCFGFIALLPLYCLRGMAAGDVKLVMTITGIIGYQSGIYLILYTFIFGGAFAICIVLANGLQNKLLSNLKAMFLNVVYKTGTKVDLELFCPEQQSIGTMPYVPAIFTSFIYLFYSGTIKI